MKGAVSACVLALFVLLLLPSCSTAMQSAPDSVYVVELEGIINPPAADYIRRALGRAEEGGAQLVVIQLDTPGGLDASMRDMIQVILSSRIPVVVYVAPAGARAASAGLFVLMASHIAAMAPGTNTGAAHPVGLGGEEMDEVMTSKVVNDAAATIRALAMERGRNAEWAERAVRESVSITADEALEMGVVDIRARNLDELLEELDGRSVEAAGSTTVLRVAGAPVIELSMNVREQFLHLISDPNIAFVLLSLGTIGIVAELYSPGTFIPGITGAISLILAFFSLGNLPTNWAGVALVVLAIVLAIAELATEGTGALGIGAVIAFLLGGLILFEPFAVPSPVLPDVRVDPWLLIGMTAALAALLLYVFAEVVRSRFSPAQSGPEGLVGQTAVVYEDLNPSGRVRYAGQLWYAESGLGAPVPKGERVRIVRVEGLTLIVEPLPGSGPEG